VTIKKGEDWGSRGWLPDDAPVVDSDLSLAALFSATRSPDSEEWSVTGPSHVGLAGAGQGSAHDLARTVSARATPEQLRSSERTHLPIDLSIVTVDDAVHVMAASLVIRQRLWSGVVEGAMNASFLGDWNVTPSGHPNDGRLDIVRAELSIGDAWKARSRLRSGTHVPHPKIQIRRLKEHRFTPSEQASVQIDGKDVGHARI